MRVPGLEFDYVGNMRIVEDLIYKSERAYAIEAIPKIIVMSLKGKKRFEK